MSRVLILGGLGMLGHQLAATLNATHEVTVTMRDAVEQLPPRYPSVDVIGDIELRSSDTLAALFAAARWDVVINAAGVIKHRAEANDATQTIAINALLPHELAAACARNGMRLIHFSTDCVFSGATDSARGPQGYRIGDPPDARDLYGLSKLLGEVDGPGTLCLRTSLIGPELRGYRGLLDWYLRQTGARVRGYTQALFTGLTTPVAARLVDFLIREQPALQGLWHIASEPVSKYALLQAVRERFGRGAPIDRWDAFHCDRRLDGGAFRERTGWCAPGWPQMIDELAQLDSRCAS
jgi:dTDP-4-dehydrorhamnose reductase